MRQIVKTSLALAAVAALSLTACSSRTADTTTPAASGAATTAMAGFPADSLVGVALPSKTSENWVLAGDLFTQDLKDAGFKSDVQYAAASGTVADQQGQITAMVTKGAKVIIIG
ncbi:MAG: sugar ABC transporter substrate-binding protein, partial [Cellulomonas sp.]